MQRLQDTRSLAPDAAAPLTDAGTESDSDTDWEADNDEFCVALAPPAVSGAARHPVARRGSLLRMLLERQGAQQTHYGRAGPLVRSQSSSALHSAAAAGAAAGSPSGRLPLWAARSSPDMTPMASPMLREDRDLSCAPGDDGESDDAMDADEAQGAAPVRRRSQMLLLPLHAADSLTSLGSLSSIFCDEAGGDVFCSQSEEDLANINLRKPRSISESAADAAACLGLGPIPADDEDSQDDADTGPCDPRAELAAVDAYLAHRRERRLGKPAFAPGAALSGAGSPAPSVASSASSHSSSLPPRSPQRLARGLYRWGGSALSLPSGSNGSGAGAAAGAPGMSVGASLGLSANCESFAGERGRCASLSGGVPSTKKKVHRHPRQSSTSSLDTHALDWPPAHELSLPLRREGSGGGGGYGSGAGSRYSLLDTFLDRDWVQVAGGDGSQQVNNGYESSEADSDMAMSDASGAPGAGASNLLAWGRPPSTCGSIGSEGSANPAPMAASAGLGRWHGVTDLTAI